MKYVRMVRDWPGSEEEKLILQITPILAKNRYLGANTTAIKTDNELKNRMSTYRESNQYRASWGCTGKLQSPSKRRWGNCSCWGSASGP